MKECHKNVVGDSGGNSCIGPVSLIGEKLVDKHEKVRIAAVTATQTLLHINPFGPTLFEDRSSFSPQPGALQCIQSEFKARVLDVFTTVYSLLSCPGLDHSDKFLNAISSLFCGENLTEMANWVEQNRSLKEEIAAFLERGIPRAVLKLNYRSLMMAAHSQKNANIIGHILKQTYLNEQNELGMSLVWIPLINRLPESQFPLLERIFKFFLLDSDKKIVHLDRMVPVYFEILGDPADCLRFPILQKESTYEILCGTCNLLSLLAPLFPSAMLGGVQTVLIPIISELHFPPQPESNFRPALVKPILGVIRSVLHSNLPLETSGLRGALLKVLTTNHHSLIRIDSRSFVDCLSAFKDGPVRIQGFLDGIEDELKSSPVDIKSFVTLFTAFIQMIGLCVSLRGKIIESWAKSREGKGDDDGAANDDYMCEHVKKATLQSEFRRLCNESILGGALGRFVFLLEDLVMLNGPKDSRWLQVLRVSSFQTLGVMSSWCTQLTERVSPVLFRICSDVSGRTDPECQQTALIALCDLLNRDEASGVNPKNIMSTLVETTQNSERLPELRVRAVALLAACLLGNLVPFENHLHHLALFTSDRTKNVASCSRDALLILFRQRVKGPSAKAKTIYRIVHSFRDLSEDDHKKKESLQFLFSELLPSSQHGALSVLLIQSIALNPTFDLLSYSLSKIHPSLLSLQKLQNNFDELSVHLADNPSLRDRILEHLDHARSNNDSKQLAAVLKERLLKRKTKPKKPTEDITPRPSHRHLMDIQEVGFELIGV